MFSCDAKHALAMMISAARTKEMQAKLWAEATKTSAILGNSLPNDDAVETGEQAERPQHNLTRLKN